MKSKKKRLNQRKIPKQERSKKLVEDILTAATRILAKDGLEAFTTERVAQKTGISVGSLYQYFPNKDALMSLLLDRMIAEELAILDEEGPKSLQPAEQIYEMISRMVELRSKNPLFRRILLQQGPRLQGPDQRVDLLAQVSQRIAERFMPYQERLEVENLYLAAFILVNAVESSSVSAFSIKQPRIESQELIQELYALAVRYLGVS